MKKYYSLFILFTCLLHLEANSQTVIIGAGTSNGTSANGAANDAGPIYKSSATSAFIYSCYHYLYTPADLSALPAGSLITGIAWNLDNNAGMNTNFLMQIWLKNSALTTIQTVPQTLAAVTTGSTQVLNTNSAFFGPTTGWVHFNTTPFLYTGGALELSVNSDMSQGTSPWTTLGFSWKKDPIVDRVIGYCGSTPSSTMTNARTVRPQLRITYIPGTPCAGQPTTGTASSSVTQACASQPFNVGLTGYTNGGGINIQWQSRVGTSGPWIDITGATSASASVTQAALSQYRAYIVCTNGGLSDTSQPVTVGMTLCYCVPVYANGGTTDNISNVQLGTLSNNTAGAGNPSPYYVDYTSQQPGTIAIPTLIQGQSYTLSATFTTDPNQYSGVWVDFNQDGTLSSVGEYFTTNSNAGANGTANIPINVPVNATPGLTRLRIRGGDDSQPSSTQACGASNSTWGEAEDYLVNIKVACNDPTNLGVTNITTTTATISWGPTPQITPAVGSEYVVTTSATPPASGTYSASSTVNITGLTPNTVYYVHVRNQCPAGMSGWTTISFITSDLNCAVSPSALAATNITFNSADLSWNAISGVTGYEYIIDQNPQAPVTGSGTPIAANNFNTGATLNHGTTYYLHVRTACAGPTYSSWTTLSFNTLLCDTPNVSNVNNITVNSATVWWNPVPGVLGYEYAVTTSVTPPASGTFTTNTLENVSNLNAGTTYYLHVRSNCDVNVYSMWKTYSFQTLPCSAPAAAVSGITFNSANISWVALAGALGYEYSFGTVATPPATGTATTALSYATGTVLTPNTTYYFHVRAQCGPTTFSPWTTVSFTTLTCLPPVGLSFTNITTGSVTMNWGAPGAPSSTASGYEYVISQSTATPAGAGIFNAGTVATASNITVPPNSPLLPDTWYYVHVRSICYPNGGVSDWILDSFKTLEPCPPVTGLKVSNVWFDAIDVTWNSAPYSNYYQYSIGTASLPPSVGTNITDTTFRARGLRDDAVYYAHVRSMCTQVPSSLWETIQFKTTSLSVNGVSSANEGLSAYPNPVTDRVTVEWSGRASGSATIQLTDVTGKVLKTIPMEGNRAEIEMSELSPAIYFLRYHDEEQHAIIKINKE